jgi:hypothetical protein
MQIKNRSEDLPTVVQVDSHPLALTEHERIFIIMADMSTEGMGKLWDKGSQCSAPKDGPGSIGELSKRCCL